MGFDALARGRKAAAVEAGPVEGPWDLPDGWRWERLGNLVEKSSAKHQPDKESHLPFVGLEHIPPHEMRIEGVGSFADMRSAGSAFLPGDVLYGRLRPYLNKVWVADRAGACSGELLVLRPKAGMDARYIALNLHSQRYVYYASHIVTGDRPRIDFDLVGAFPVPVPDEGTQRQVVTRIDALFAEIDEGEAALAEARAGVETYRKALLKAAVTGELTADWRAANPPQETGEQLLAHILADRRARWHADPKNARKKYTEPAGPDADGLPELPDGWVWASLDQLIVGTPQNGAYFPASQYGDGVPIYRIDDFQVGTAKAVSELRQVNVRDNATAPYRIEVGDLVINRVNSPSHLGKSFLVKEEHAGAIFESNMMRAKGNPLVNLDFLALYLASDGGRSRLCKNAKAAVNQSSINQGDVRATQVPLPSISEQTAILSAVNAAAAEGQETGYVIQDCARTAATLRQSILAAALRGELSA